MVIIPSVGLVEYGDLWSVPVALQRYQEHKQSQGGNDDLDGPIDLLKVSSVLIRNFTSSTPYFSLADKRFVENDDCLAWLDSWNEYVKAMPLPTAERSKRFLSTKTYFDITSMIVGFRQLCRQCFLKHPGCSIVSAKVNTNVVENMFCQIRGALGQNDNLTYREYGKCSYCVKCYRNFIFSDKQN